MVRNLRPKEVPMKLRRPSPATVIAVVSLLVALSSTAYAANVVPLAKRALVADNAKALKTKTPAQIAAMPGPATTLNGKTADDIAATPGPASTAVGTVVVKTKQASLASFDIADFSAECDPGQKAVGGGWETDVDNRASVFPFDSRPSADDTAWKLVLASTTSTDVALKLYAICVK
jgi:hypothetical protein